MSQDAPEQAPAVVGVRQDFTAGQVLELLRATFPPDKASCHWSACFDAIGPLASGVPGDLTGWTEGRAWSTHAEVRWRQLSDGRFSVLFVGEGMALPDGFAAVGVELRAVPGEEQEGLYLWGTRGPDGRYHSTRLGRPLEYSGLEREAPEPRVPYRLLLGPTGDVRFLRLALPEQA